jgi:hypothetical protein
MPTLTAPRLATLILFLGLLAIAMRVSVDSDSFWHLRAGAWMLDHNRVLDFDVFSHTMAGRPWMNHSWLSELAMAAIYRSLGYGGLNLVTALVVCLTFAVVHRSCEGGAYLKALIVLLAAASSASYWAARPQILSLLLVAVFAHVLARSREDGRLRSLWILPPLMAAWVNLHGGFVLGFLLIGLAFVGAVIRTAATRAQKGTPLGLRAFGPALATGAVGLACAVMAGLNPHGWTALIVPVRTVSIGVLQDYIQEWQSPNFHNPGPQLFIAMWIATFGALGASRRRLDVTDFLTFAAFGTLSLLAARNIALFAVVTAPILSRHASSALAWARERWPRLAENARAIAPSAGALALHWATLVLVVTCVALKTAQPLDAVLNRRIIAESSPVGAANYLRRHPVRGSMFNAYNFGGYLAWALPPVPVYVDGRTDLYDQAFLQQYIRTYMANAGWEHTLDERNIGVVIVDPQAPIAQALVASPRWSLQYRDRVAVVISRNR